MPSKPGDFCARCGFKTERVRQGDFIVANCPKGHGEQGREPAPEEEAPAEPAAEEAQQ